MKNPLALFIFISFTIMAFLISCSSNSIQEKATIDNYVEELESFYLQSVERVKANDKTILELKEAIKHLEESTKTEYLFTIDQLEERNKLMNKKIRNYNDFTSEKWKAFKVKFGQDMDELEKELKNLSTKLIISSG